MSEERKNDAVLLQWYPGHMTKARRSMEEDVKKVDLVIELLDARAPLSSKNPDIDRIAKDKYRLILLNKADLADEMTTRTWSAYFKALGLETAALDSRAKNGAKTAASLIPGICREKIEKARKKGFLNVTVRAMIAGIPNVGKSTLINTFSGKGSAKTGNKPGVTRGSQWIRVGKDLDLLDTPGILWPKFEDPDVGLALASIGSIRDDVLPTEEVAAWILERLRLLSPDAVLNRYGLSSFPENGMAAIEAIAEKKNCRSRGGALDCLKAAGFVIDDFRHGKFGRVSLEAPPEREQ